jgi:RpiR family carbohydrate utilization transcriptional regulator
VDHLTNAQLVIPEGVLARLRATYDTLTDAEQRVADFIEQQPEQAIHLSVKRLAERIGTSEATIIRCCQSLGYAGLRDLKLALASETATPFQAVHEDILPGDDMPTIARKVLQADIQAIADTLAVLDYGALELAVQALVAASRIEFFGVGSSTPVVMDAFYRFLRIGLPTATLADPHMQVVSAAQLPEGAVAFAVSHTGRSIQTRSALRAARSAGATCILLTSHANTPVSKYADIQLVTTSERESVRHPESVARRIAQLSVIDALCVAVSLRRTDRAIKGIVRASAILDEHMIP